MPSNVTLCPSNKALCCNVGIIVSGSLAVLSCLRLVEGRGAFLEC